MNYLTHQDLQNVRIANARKFPPVLFAYSNTGGSDIPAIAGNIMKEFGMTVHIRNHTGMKQCNDRYTPEERYDELRKLSEKHFSRTRIR